MTKGPIIPPGWAPMSYVKPRNYAKVVYTRELIYLLVFNRIKQAYMRMIT